MPAKYTPEQAFEKFWSRTNRVGDCLEWQSQRLPRGYGVAYMNGKQTTAHRVAYEITYGPIPPGMFVLHRCDNPPCVNPSHLFLGTHTDNMQDMLSKGRYKTIPDHAKVRGERHGNAKLTADTVRAIRQRATTESVKALAGEFGVSERYTRRLIARQTWKHVK